nr:MAG TPA: hypothetical protein [Caudoviricetes sp.]
MSLSIHHFTPNHTIKAKSANITISKIRKPVTEII